MVKTTIVALLLLACSLRAQSAPSQPVEPEGIKQPIEFSHRLHVTELKQPCKTCHADTDPGELVDMPDTAQCLACHSKISARSKAEQKLLAFGKQNRSIDWVRVYQIPTFVRFDHRQHSNAGVQCASCHGPVQLRRALWTEHDLSMGTCVTCHRQMGASLDCASCHESR
jgi:hypothetical protein